ncbi:hypothetical protein [Pseudonocardia autotrophica]|nr:hypothetical protein [Pseudonocardia autotrophica]
MAAPHLDATALTRTGSHTTLVDATHRYTPTGWQPWHPSTDTQETLP